MPELSNDSKLNRHQILIIDDDPDTTQQISEILGTDDNKVHYILDPSFTFDTLNLIPIELILLDVYLPRIDGITLLKQIKEHELYRDIPVIMLTADIEEDLVANCLEAGAVDFLRKPIQKIELQARVQSALRTSGYISQLKETLQEKEVLLKEIHHRVKNNLQIISSLFLLQSNQTEDVEFQHTLKECRGRVESMSMIHEKLYQSRNLARIDMGLYTKELVREIFYSYDKEDQKIKLVLEVESIFLGVDMAVPSALIINELVSNALKYAFPEDSGTLLIRLENIADSCRLIVKDDGRGMPDSVDFYSTNTLGLRLVRLLTSQLKGEVTINKGQGTEFYISFPLEANQ